MNIRSLGIDYNALSEKGLITIRNHDNFPLRILNYTPKAQYDRMWDHGVNLCRGIIIDNEDNIIARPFPKFFNLEELDIPLPEEQYTVTQKMDGSLGVLYWWNNTPYIATRGSFHSEQANEANKMIHNYPIGKLDRDYTYLFEIIYPENRIVVDYGNSRRLVMLAKININTGVEENIKPYRKYFDVVKNLSISSEHPSLIRGLYENETDEGVVLFYPGSQFRVKIKWAKYLELHRAKFGLNNIVIWEAIKANGYEVLRKTLPEEALSWADNVSIQIGTDYVKTKLDVDFIYDQIVHSLHGMFSRKEFALKAKEERYAPLLFMKLDNRISDDDIMNFIKPKEKKQYEINSNGRTTGIG